MYHNKMSAVKYTGIKEKKYVVITVHLILIQYYVSKCPVII